MSWVYPFENEYLIPELLLSTAHRPPLTLAVKEIYKALSFMGQSQRIALTPFHLPRVYLRLSVVFFVVFFFQRDPESLYISGYFPIMWKSVLRKLPHARLSLDKTF